jgi:23S rRNA (uracil1939-C5)-methyltransferase
LSNGKPDVIITDPPRGMHEDVVKAILKAAPGRIVYVSCNTSTQARDILLLSDDYKVAGVQPVDMFPHTHHGKYILSYENLIDRCHKSVYIQNYINACIGEKDI